MKRKGSSLLALGLSASMLLGTVVPAYGITNQTTLTSNEQAVLQTALQTASEQQTTSDVNESQLSPWLITEVATDTISGEKYTYLEIYNNSDKELNFANYTLYYDYPNATGGYVFSKNGKATYTNGKEYTSGAYLSAESEEKLTSIPVASGETLVIWYCNNLKTTSLSELRNYYGMDETTTVIRVPHGGIHKSAKRGYRIGKDSDTVIVEAYSNEYGNEIADGNNKLAYQYTYPTSGIKCSKISIETATPGTVLAGQVPTKRVSVVETKVEIKKVTATGNGDFLVSAEIPYEGTAGAMAVNLTYTQSAGTGEETITSAATTVGMTPAGDGKTFSFALPGTEIFGTSITYSITAGYSSDNKVTTAEQAVTMNANSEAEDDGAPLIITEIAPSDEPYDFVEVYNQSDKTINLSYWNLLYYYDYPNLTAAQSGKTWSISDFELTIEPGETVVYWLNSAGNTVEEFNAHYGSNLVEGENIVKVNYGGLHNTDARWFRIGTSESTAFTLAGFNEEAWQKISAGNGSSLNYAVPVDYSGITESVPVSVDKATPGTVKSWQVKGQVTTFDGYPGYAADDGQPPTLNVCESEGKLVPESINEGETLQVAYDVDRLVGATSDERINAFDDDKATDGTSNHPGGDERLKTRPNLIGTEIYYKLDDESQWTVIQEKKQGALGHYWMQIPSDILYGHDSVTFKVRAYTLYGYSETEENTVKINRLNDTKGTVRVNVNDGEILSGVQTITANDGNNNADTVIKVDGEEQTTRKTLEDGAYFLIKTSGIDSYFKNAITAPCGDNLREIITFYGSWRETPTSRAIHVDNKYFVYNEETDSYDVTLTVWAGGHGTPFEEIYDVVKDANHEDFSVSGLQLKLANGNSYLPTLITPDNAKTNTDTSLEASHVIGDSAGMSPYMNVTFSVPVADAEAVGIALDTTTLEDGEHTITAIAGDKTTTTRVVVDNKAPEINLGITQGATIYDDIIIDGTMITDENGVDEVVVALDDEVIEIPKTIIPRELTAGEHTIKVVATDVAGNVATSQITFVTEEVDPNVLNSNSSEIGYNVANISVELEGKQLANVTFYEGQTLNIENSGITTDGVVNSSEGEAPYQIFDINTGNVSDDTEIALNWSGLANNTDETHLLTMFARNLNTNNWDVIGTADAAGNISVELLAKDYVADGKATVLVQCVTDGTQANVYEGTIVEEEAQELSDWDGTGRPENYDFSFAWITDTQYYAESFPYHFAQMNQWIVDNAEEWGIRYVFHTGDIVDDCDMLGEWENADSSMRIFDEAGIAYGVLGGNHDVWAGAEGYGSYWKYFGEDRFADKDYYGGSYKNNRGHYDLLTENGQDFIIIYMSWDIYEEEINWMNQVLEEYSDRKAILAFHRYIDTSGNLDYTGELIQEEVVAKNPNIFAVIDGHYHGASFRTDKFDDDGDGIEERTVYQICTDYQSDPEGGSEYIKFMYFDLENNKLYMNSYSPYRNDFNYYNKAKLSDYSSEQKVGAIDILEFDVDFGGTESYNKTLVTNAITADVRTTSEIGTVENVSENVIYTWKGLTPETAYSWYAKVTNVKNGVTYTAVESFETEAKPYTIKASAGAGGSINNSGQTSVAKGASMTYTIKADAGYRVCTVFVDDKVVELNNGAYTFENVDADHVIVVLFEKLVESDDTDNSNVGEDNVSSGSDDSKSEDVSVEIPQASVDSETDSSTDENITSTMPLSPGQTGDSSNTLPYVMVLILAVGVALGTVFMKKKKTN